MAAHSILAPKESHGAGGILVFTNQSYLPEAYYELDMTSRIAGKGEA
jgi:hypothetical protein